MAIYVSEFLGGAERIFFSVGQILGGVNSLGGVGSWRTPLVLDVAFPYHIVFTTLATDDLFILKIFPCGTYGANSRLVSSFHCMSVSFL